MKKNIVSGLLLVLIFFASACRKEEFRTPSISGVNGDTIVLNIGEKIVLAPNITNLKGNTYTWLVNGQEKASNQLNYTFEATASGNFDVTFRVGNKGGVDEQTFKIFVEKAIEVTIADQLNVSMCNVLEITPAVTGPERDDYDYQWSIGDSVIGKQLNLSFISPEAGTFELTLRATAGNQVAYFKRTINVKAEAYVKNAYTVLEYAPAPGRNHNWSIIGYKELWQYGHEFPLPYSQFLAKASELRKESVGNGLFLGSWGGSATFKFDHTVANAAGKPDIELQAYHSNRDYPAVYVAYDRNKNGQPDADEWYEIKNDDYGLEDLPDYQITFTYDSTKTDARRFYSYFTWKDNQLEPVRDQIVLNKAFAASMTTAGVYSTRGFFPGLNVTDNTTKAVAFLDGWQSSFTRKGKRITKNLSGAPPFAQKLSIDIDKAVDARGVPVQLPGVDFVKVQKVVYPFHQDGLTGFILTDYNMMEERMLYVEGILDRHLKN